MILCNILNFAELDYSQIKILRLYVPSSHAYTRVLCLSLDLPSRQGSTTIIEAPFKGVDVVEWSRALDVRLSEWCCSVSMV